MVGSVGVTAAALRSRRRRPPVVSRGRFIDSQRRGRRRPLFGEWSRVAAGPQPAPRGESRHKLRSTLTSKPRRERNGVVSDRGRRALGARPRTKEPGIADGRPEAPFGEARGRRPDLHNGTARCRGAGLSGIRERERESLFTARERVRRSAFANPRGAIAIVTFPSFDFAARKLVFS